MFTKLIMSVCEKLSKVESYLNNVPLEKRKRLVLVSGVVLVFLLIGVSGFHKWRHKTNIVEESRTERVSIVENDMQFGNSLSAEEKADAILNRGNRTSDDAYESASKKALHIIDSLQKVSDVKNKK